MLFILSILLHLDFLVSPPSVFYKNDSGFSSYLFSFIPVFPSVFLAFLYHAIVVVQALRLNYILQNNQLVPQTFLPAMMYVLFVAIIPYWNNITPALLSNFFILWLLQISFRLAKSEKKDPICFDIGFITGMSILFYTPMLMLSLVMLLSIIIFSSFTFKKLLFYLLGIIVPLYLLFGITYLTNNLHLIAQLQPHFGWELPAFLSSKDLLFSSIAILTMVILGAANGHYSNLLIVARNGWTFIIIMFLLTGLSIFFMINYSFETLLVIMLPAAALASNFFIHNKSKIISALLFWILFLLSYFSVLQEYLFVKK